MATNDEKNEMTVSIEINGEFMTTKVQRNSAVRALFDGGHLRGIDVSAIRVNGLPATPDQILEDEDTVQTVPTSGRLA